MDKIQLYKIQVDFIKFKQHLILTQATYALIMLDYSCISSFFRTLISKSSGLMILYLEDTSN